jgi:transcriptional regulator with XRE-family HTH domain
MTAAWDRQMQALGSYIRTQRQLANLSLRQLADLASVSNPYLSQVERGLHQPSMRVLKSIAEALNISAETLLARAGLISDDDDAPPAAGKASAVEDAIRADTSLSEESKTMMLTLYKTLRSKER